MITLLLRVFVTSSLMLWLGFPTAIAQKIISTDSLNLSDPDNVASWYYQQNSKTNSTLVLGAYNENTRTAMRSHPHFFFKTWEDGSICYRGEVFKDIQLIYNIEQDKVLLKHPEGFTYTNQPIELNQAQVSWFWLGRFLFKYYDFDETPNKFMQVLHDGDVVSLIVKRTKLVIINSDNRSEYRPEDKYYILYNNTLNRVMGRGSFQRIFKQHKQAIKSFIKENHIPGMKNTTDEQFAMIAKYCDQLEGTAP